MVPLKYLYKIYDEDGAYVGLLKNVQSEFDRVQDINTAGSQIYITAATRSDVASQAVEPIETESGIPIETEDGRVLTTEGAHEVLGENSGLIVEGYGIVVHEFSKWNPNGVVVFRGFISKVRLKIGGDNLIGITCINDSFDLDQHIVLPSPVIDTSYANQNASYAIYTGTTNATTRKGLQIFAGRPISSGAIGTTQENITGVTIYGAAQNALAPTTLKIYITTDSTGLGSGLLNLSTTVATGTLTISSTSPQEHYIALDKIVTYQPDTYYAFYIEASGASGSGFNLYYYTAGPVVVFPFNVFNGSSWVAPTGGGDVLYMRMWVIPDATLIPIVDMEIKEVIEQTMDLYLQDGGLVTYSDASVDLTGVRVTLDYQTNTMYESTSTLQQLAPADFYWYVSDDNELQFKRSNTTADHTFFKGKHISDFELTFDTEGIKNVSYFSGGDTGSGTNLLVREVDEVSKRRYRQRLARPSNNRVTNEGTGRLFARNEIDSNSAPKYVTDVEIPHDTYNLSLIRLGDTANFAGFGLTIIDNLILQIVRIRRGPRSATLYLGLVPFNQYTQVESISRQLKLQQTVDNPTSPS